MYTDYEEFYVSHRQLSVSLIEIIIKVLLLVGEDDQYMYVMGYV